jgi:hypothetical protein
MWSSRQAGHQHPVAAASPAAWADADADGDVAVAAGTGTTGGRRVHQHGASLPSTIPQPKPAPQRLQMLI